ncbi:hypothetical protein [Streptomyces sp. NPDC056672]|uniref:hypothetical protein n=1 Tax=Streptomyces sp. NPDC056672 TaxID=3345906 RepID=UPI0036AC4959
MVPPPRRPRYPQPPHHRGGLIPTPSYTPEEIETAADDAVALLTEALDPSGPAEDVMHLMAHTIGRLLQDPNATFDQVTESWMRNEGQTADEIRRWWGGW